MAKRTRQITTDAAYSFSEYLEKFRPRPLPDAPRADPRSDDLADEIVSKALQKIRKCVNEKSVVEPKE